MTEVGRYSLRAGGDSLRAEGRAAGRFDECVAPDGTIRRGWQPLVDQLSALDPQALAELNDDVTRLLADDGVTYTPTGVPSLLPGDGAVVPGEPRPGAATAGSALAEPQPWQLDPVPLVLDGGEWARIELGLAQRAELFNRILTDLYTDQQLLASGAIPPLAVYSHPDYLRALVGPAAPGAHQLVMTGTDLGRDAGGDWHVLADRTQAPSGAGYAMQNRRVVSRVLPQLYQDAHLFRLTPYFHTLRMSLVDAAPDPVEDPRVVVLSPGTHSETAFDQAFLASLLGFPLVEGNDLVVREGRVWMRSVGKVEPVDVILRRVDADWTDPLELRAGSRLGVTGLVDCVRAGTVTVVNSLGSGVMENPALHAYLPQLCAELLGEDLRLPSVPTWWCGDPEQRRYVLDNLGSLVVRGINRGDGRSLWGGRLDRDRRRELAERITAEPHRFVGQAVLPLSSAPTLRGPELDPRPLVLRTFAIRRGRSYRAMTGGLAQLLPLEEMTAGEIVAARDHSSAADRVTKDVWVVSADGTPGPSAQPAEEPLRPARVAVHTEAMVPRVLDDLFWFGRYAERAEDLLRLVLSARHVAVETDFAVRPGGELEVLLAALTQLSATYPGVAGGDADPLSELRELVLQTARPGSVARCIGALGYAAQGVRDQLSDDVWMVLAGIDRALTALRAARLDRGNQLADSGERVLSGLLALSGITAENMVRDSGWYLLDAGRGLERALQVVSLLQHTLTARRQEEVEEAIVEAALNAAESIVTFRRRYARGFRHADVLELLVRDPDNPRSVAFQLHRVQRRLASVPGTEITSRPMRLAAEVLDRTQSETLSDLLTDGPVDPGDTAVAGDPGERVALGEWLGALHDSLSQLAEAISEQYLQPAPVPRSIALDDTVGS